MHDPLTAASFFTGAAGLDMGLERAGIRHVSHAELERFPAEILVERYGDGIPNLGDVTRIRPEDVPAADLWTGGFPCQDLSVAGRRRGLAGARSGLAFAFLDLVADVRPAAVLVENVPGLLSSHRGRDLGTLLGRLGELGYWWAYRVLDAQFFGVPQRRRRVFILAFHAALDPRGDGPAEVLSVGSRCRGHHPAYLEEGPDPRDAGRPGGGARGDGSGILEQSISAKWAKGSSGPAGDEHHTLVVVGAPADPARARARSGVAGRVDGPEGVDLRPFRKQHRAASVDDDETWIEADLVNTVTPHDAGDKRAVDLVVGGEAVEDDPRLPVGQDYHRTRAIGNGVAAPVAEWLGERLVTWWGSR
jgi:site-specific DNA-cytosine methylase